MDHTAGNFVFDQQGRIRLLVPYGAGPAVFAHDLAQSVELAMRTSRKKGHAYPLFAPAQATPNKRCTRQSHVRTASAGIGAVLLTLALAAQFFTTQALGAEAIVDGTLSCAQWVKLRAGGEAAAAEFWLSGVLLNLAPAEGVDVSGEDPSTYHRWMDRYCEADGRSTIGDGAKKLLQELKRQRRQAAVSAWPGERLAGAQPVDIGSRVAGGR